MAAMRCMVCGVLANHEQGLVPSMVDGRVVTGPFCDAHTMAELPLPSIALTPEERRYLLTLLVDIEPLPHIVYQNRFNEYVEVCRDCRREIWDDDEEGCEQGHATDCPRETRYALLAKLEGYDE